MRFLVVWAGVVLVSGLALAKLQAEEMPDLTNPKVITAGHEIYLEKQCAHCHGEDGKGGVNLVQRTLDAKGVFTSIADGRERNGIRMPEWRGVLSDKQIWEATAYVLSISQPSKKP
ncbi:cytochrome c [Bradyrhizobium sp. AUGA SZCCT0431]|uniref:c-type cytochrome n=1 Tax=Bradyrhizobium sp. AUGA SZCCT0431 TaxID=2807674 RepID=UPI001BA7C51B|nr:cytochrome c [Bradyrhizobium sp. AUGA SZCCT0431]MBR1147195.1 cytochrome c [Bradyrhizobium sp. AUGA SZCCT0431]